MTIAEKLPPQQTVNGHSFNAEVGGQGPFYFDGCNTLPKLFRQNCEKYASKIAHREKDLGIWLSYSWTDFYEHARLIGLGLLSLGLKRGEVISILSEDNKEWVYIDMGVQFMRTACTELMFLTSTIGVRSPFAYTRFTLGSQRRLPSCMLPSLVPT